MLLPMLLRCNLEPKWLRLYPKQNPGSAARWPGPNSYFCVWIRCVCVMCEHPIPLLLLDSVCVCDVWARCSVCVRLISPRRVSMHFTSFLPLADFSFPHAITSFHSHPTTQHDLHREPFSRGLPLLSASSTAVHLLRYVRARGPVSGSTQRRPPADPRARRRVHVLSICPHLGPGRGHRIDDRRPGPRSVLTCGEAALSFRRTGTPCVFQSHALRLESSRSYALNIDPGMCVVRVQGAWPTSQVPQPTRPAHNLIVCVTRGNALPRGWRTHARMR